MSGKKPRSAIADFEKQFAELEHIVNRMESADQPLDASLEDFEKGMALCKNLRKALEEAEQKVQILVSNQDGDPLQPFSPDSDEK